MQVICRISHCEDLPGGGFRHYEAGQVYDKDSYEPGLFEPVEEVDIDG